MTRVTFPELIAAPGWDCLCAYLPHDNTHIHTLSFSFSTSPFLFLLVMIMIKNFLIRNRSPGLRSPGHVLTPDPAIVYPVSPRPELSTGNLF